MISATWMGIRSTTIYRWYDRYRAFGEAGLVGHTSGLGRVWNHIPDDVRQQIVELALNEPELSPRALAVTFTDTKGYVRFTRNFGRRRHHRPTSLVGPNRT